MACWAAAGPSSLGGDDPIIPVMRGGRLRAVLQRDMSDLGVARQATVVAGALVLAVGIYLFAIYSSDFGDAPLFLLVVPMALMAFAYGLKGGIVSTLVGSGLATAWWIGKDYPGGASWYCSRIAGPLPAPVLTGS